MVILLLFLEKKTFKTEGFACHCLFNLSNIFIGDHMHFFVNFVCIYLNETIEYIFFYVKL